MARLPRSIKIVVHDGRNLAYRLAGSKNTPQTRKWRVIFIGGEKKQATGIVDEQDGFPRWDCEVLIETPKPVESVRMLVVDGKEREVGQVVIDLAQELPWSPGGSQPPALVTSQLHVRDLVPTRHNPSPCGQLSFWMWSIDYWPEGTVPIAVETGGSGKHNIRGSISHLTAAIKSSQHGSQVAGSSSITGGVEERGHSRLGNKLRDIKHRVGGRNGSVVSGSVESGDRHKRHHRGKASPLPATAAPVAGGAGGGGGEEGSVLMGASILSSHPGTAIAAGGWSGAGVGGGGASELNADLTPMAGGGGGSYNPLAAADEADNRRESLFVGGGGGGGGGVGVSGFSGDTADPWAVPMSAVSPAMENGGGGGVPGERKSRRKQFAENVKSRLSRSSANLSELGHKIRSRRSSPDGSRCEQEGKVFHDDTPPSIGPTDLPPRRPEARPIIHAAENGLQPNPRFAENMKEEWGLPSTGQPVNPLGPPKPTISGTNGTATASAAANYGLHPEEGPGKSKEDMTKRELIDLATMLEERLIATRTEVVKLNMETNQLNAQIEDLNSELTLTRTQLLNLRNRLLADNLTQYLEVNGSADASASGLVSPRAERLTTFDNPGGGSGAGSALRNGGGSFLTKAKALAHRSFGGGGGGGALNGATSQPNLSGLSSTNQGLGMLGGSPGSPARRPQPAPPIDYGSVW